MPSIPSQNTCRLLFLFIHFKKCLPFLFGLGGQSKCCHLIKYSQGLQTFDVHVHWPPDVVPPFNILQGREFRKLSAAEGCVSRRNSGPLWRWVQSVPSRSFTFFLSKNGVTATWNPARSAFISHNPRIFIIRRSDTCRPSKVQWSRWKASHKETCQPSDGANSPIWRSETLFTDLHTSVDGWECAAKALDKWHSANQSLGRSHISYKVFGFSPIIFSCAKNVSRNNALSPDHLVARHRCNERIELPSLDKWAPSTVVLNAQHAFFYPWHFTRD